MIEKSVEAFGKFTAGRRVPLVNRHTGSPCLSNGVSLGNLDVTNLSIKVRAEFLRAMTVLGNS